MSGTEKRTRREDSFRFLCTVLTNGWIKDYSLAIDGGANVGIWAKRMANQFKRVIAFEPAPEVFAELKENTFFIPRIECHQLALLDGDAAVDIVKPDGKSLRSLYVQAVPHGNVRAIPIDSLALESCGFIKLDLEGAEMPALLGATETIAKFRPTLMIEVDRYGDRFGWPRDAVERQMRQWRYVMAGECRPDQVFIPKERA